MPVAHLIPPYDRDVEAAKLIEQRADAQCRARRPDGRAPEPPFKTDGCSGFFDGDWARCCVDHDIAYWCGGGEADRRRADHAFHACLLDGRHADAIAECEVGLLATCEGSAPDSLVHRLEIRNTLGKVHLAEGRYPVAERHFRGVRIEAGSAAIPGLIRLVRAEIVETDWRRASQAIVLSHALPDEQIVPWLIEGLQTWKERGEKGLQALRIEHEIELQLEQRSGRKLGLHAENWSAWWEAVKAGRVKQVSTPSGWPEPTRPSFFGLDPRSDRVLFVIDRSGSMASPFDPAKTQAPNTRVRTRWQEATEQLLDFARALGERARLGIVLFHANADPWRAHLVPANERNLAAARSWLVGQKPDGGTELRRGIEEGLHVAPDGSFDLEAIEADTVIVLCDGATAEGPAWVPAFLERVNAGLRVVFHCVQIGEGGDGTLEELAKGSGGEFVRIVR